MRRQISLLSLLGANAVPGLGLFVGGWSSATALAVYWWENLFGSLLIGIRIGLHRRLTCGQPDSPNQATFNSFRADFLSTMLVFTLGHGLFLAVILLFMARERGEPLLNEAELRDGLTGMTVCLLVGFGSDLVGLRTQPFAWLKRLTGMATSRMIVVHLTIIFGGAAYSFFETSRAFFAVFMGLKTLFDLAWWWPTPKPDAAGGWIDMRTPGDA